MLMKLTVAPVIASPLSVCAATATVVYMSLSIGFDQRISDSGDSHLTETLSRAA